MHSEPHDSAWTDRPAASSSVDDRIDSDRLGRSAPGLSPSLTATAPGKLKVIKRNGTVVTYTDDKIPKRVIGKMVVIDAQETASLALITQSLREIASGDVVQMRER